ncbi:phosphoribosylformylglycinamidine synthase subunit PurL [Patescibacteria group bacterium]|nr:phosphoribosylformylglycinamidine synthase subunit PurL [Patescibacteria group bacterium]
MITRIEIVSKILDPRASAKKRKFESFGYKGKIRNVFLVDVYTIEKTFSAKDLHEITSSLHNPVNQDAYENKALPFKFNWAIEIGYLPGVTDNIANTAKEIIEDLLKTNFSQKEGVYSSQLFLIDGTLSKKEIENISLLLINPLIQRVHIKSFSSFKKSKGMDKVVPRVNLENKLRVDDINLNVSDEELIKIGKSGIENKDGTRRGPLALSFEYMKTIQEYFKKIGRKPTDIEIESIAQTWSEHCKHTIFADQIDEIQKGLFKTYIRKATEEIRKKKGKKDFCYSVFTDNSGAIEFDEKYLITHKAETHNSPSALDPFGGAITGIVGVNRDAIGFGLGAKPIANTYGYCFADPNTKKSLYRDKKLSQKQLNPRRILDGVVDGVNSGGNCSGIPTPQGFVFFHERYQGKPLVFVGTVGLIPKKINGKNSCKKKARPEDYIVVVGGRVGQDGIHGATFSSEALDSGSPATAVQIGDPITQKKLSDAIVKEARNMNLYNSITDNGAGGISCSVAEMAKESGGCEVDLDKVPLKYPGLEPWKIWISESQERMTLAVPKRNWGKFSKLMQRRGVETAVIGEFNDSGMCRVNYNGQTIMEIDMEFLHNGLPHRPMITKEPKKNHKKINLPKQRNIQNALFKLLKSLNVASFEYISSQYDHEVQASSVLKPLIGRGRINSESSAISPVLGSKKGAIFSQGLYPTYSEIDPYNMAGASIDTAIRNVVAAGGNIDKIAILDNFCWCSSNDPERLWQLKEAARGCYDFATAYETPFISGKDSMFNDFKGYDEKGKEIKISVPPTLLISSIGVIDDIIKTNSIDVKMPGDLIYLIGETTNDLGGSEYFGQLKIKGGDVPKTDAHKNKAMYRDFHKATTKGLIASSIAVTRGGLAIALAKMSMAGMLGIKVFTKKIKGTLTRDDFILFSESQGRIVATVDPKNKNEFEKLMKKHCLSLIGKVEKNDMFTIVGLNKKEIIKTKVEDILSIYKSTFKNY